MPNRRPAIASATSSTISEASSSNHGRCGKSTAGGSSGGSSRRRRPRATTDQVGHAPRAGLDGEDRERRGQRSDEGRGSGDQPGQHPRGRDQEERGDDRGDRPAPPGHVEQHRAHPQHRGEDGREPGAGGPQARRRVAATEPLGDVRRGAHHQRRQQDQHGSGRVALQQAEVQVVGGDHQHRGPEHDRRGGDQHGNADRLPPATRVQRHVDHERDAAQQRRHDEQPDAEHQPAGLDGDQQREGGHRDGEHGGGEVRRRAAGRGPGPGRQRVVAAPEAGEHEGGDGGVPAAGEVAEARDVE